jgi:carboxyl-terminal processing protease
MTTVMQTIESRGNVRGLVIDLRVSRSGSAWPLTEMLTLFGNGPLGEFYTRQDSTPIKVKGIDLGGSQKMPLVILVGPDTEGQPEIFAAALQDAARATVIGLPTAGKIFGYTTVPLPDGSRLTLATSSYKTESGKDLGETGVTPDFELKPDWDQVSDVNDPLIDKALEVILKN